MAATSHPPTMPTTPVITLLTAALNADPAAEADLAAAASNPGFATALLDAASAPGLPHPLRQLAAVMLKKVIRERYSGDDGAEVRGKKGQRCARDGFASKMPPLNPPSPHHSAVPRRQSRPAHPPAAISKRTRLPPAHRAGRGGGGRRRRRRRERLA